MINAYEIAGRHHKVIRLCLSIDAGLDLLGADPFSQRGLDAVLAMTDAAWQLAASHARVPMPSATTKAAVEEVYRRRLEIRGCLSRLTAPLPRVG